MGPFAWRRGLGVLLGVLVLGLVAAVAFQAGAHHGVSDGAAYAPHRYGWGGGFFFFPFLLFPLGFFLFFSLMRLLFWGGPRPGWGYGPGMYGEQRRQRLEDWHRRAHEAEGTPPSQTPPPPPAAPPAGPGTSA